MVMRFTPKFIFSKKVPKFVENLMEKEFRRLRPYAVDALNPNFDKWNSEYDARLTGRNKEETEENWTRYLKYINSKQREVLKQVNKAHPSALIKLDVDEDGDISARSRLGNVLMTMHLIPID